MTDIKKPSVKKAAGIKKLDNDLKKVNDIKKLDSIKNNTVKKNGRPSIYSDRLAIEICNKLSDGQSLRKICLLDEMPSVPTIFRWLENSDWFRNQYARARELQADKLFDECLDIADDGINDTYMDEHGNVKTDNDVIQRSKLRIDTRKWMAGKLRPKIYGDIVEKEQSTEMLDKISDLINKLPS